MFYPNLKLRKTVSSAKVNFTDFHKSMDTSIDEALLPYKTAKMSYNFDVKRGALTNGYGFKKLSLPKAITQGERELNVPGEPIKKMWVYRYFYDEFQAFEPELIFLTESGQLYFACIHDEAPFTLPIPQDAMFTAIPNALNYNLDSKDTLIFCSKQDGMWKYVLNEGVKKVEGAPAIISMCLHYERLFAVVGGEQNRLAFSANLDPTNWTEDLSSGGFVEMQDERGRLTKVVSFNDYVYVFREYGVSKVSAYGDQTDFSVSHLFISSVKLYGDTVCVCGNKILLLARDGVHSFDGYSTKRLQLGIDELFKNVENDNACSVYFKNKFLLACRLDFNDNEKIGCENFDGGYINNALLEIDLTTNEISITRGVDIASMLVIDDKNVAKVAVCFNGEHSCKLGEITNDGMMFDLPLKKCWVSPKSNLGYPTKIKQIKECFIKTKTPCKIRISTDKEQKEFCVLGKDVSQRVKLGMSGEQIQIEFESNDAGETYISCPQITLEISG